MTDFASRFSENLRTGAEALEEAGYDVLSYQAQVEDRNGLVVANAAETPQEALTATLDEVQDEEQLFFYVSGDELAEAIQKEQDVESLIYRNMRGVLHVDEPVTNQIQGQDGPIDVEEPYPAFGLDVRYTPEFPDDYWRVQTSETHPPFTEEDAHEQVDGIIDALEGDGFEVEKGYID